MAASSAGSPEPAREAVVGTASRRWLHPLLTVLALGLAVLPAAAPYLFGDGFPRTNDALPHLYRIVALDRLVRAGQLWPRWSPDLVHGYGYPVFNFFPAMSHWLVESLFLVGASLTAAYRLAVLIHFWLGATGAYLVGRQWFSPVAGWAAAIAYTYSPYLLYDAHVRGGLPESQALALLPWLLLALSQATGGGRRWVAASAFAFAATLLSHYPVLFQASLLLAIWLLLLAWRHGWRILVGPALGLGIGVLLTAFFWLPALSEIAYTQAALSISQGYGYTANFLSWRQMLAWPHLPADPALINPPVVRALPAVVLLLAAACTLWGRHALRGERRWQAALWLALLLLSLWLVTPSSRLLWEYVPLLGQTLYPWRFLGFTSLAAAILLALAVDLAVQRSRRPLVLSSVIVAILVIAAIPWLYPPREPVGDNPGLAELYEFEAPPLFIGTTTLGEFLPQWVERMPDTADLRAEQLATGTAERLQPAPGVTFRRLDGPVWDASYRVEAIEPVTLTYRQFYFPGWLAELDGRPLPLEPGEPHGLITFPVPAGEYQLKVTFGNTWPRRLGWLLTAAGTVGALLLLARPARQTRRQGAGKRQSRPAPNPAGDLLLAGLVLALWLFFTAVDTPLRRATLTGTGVAGRSAIETLDFAGEIRLLSLESPEKPVASDDPIPITLALRALRPIGVPYLFGVDVVDETGLVWSAARERPPDWRFVAGDEVWPLDGYRIEPFVLRLLDGTPPGEYRFRIGLVREDTRQTVAIHETGSLVVGTPARGGATLEEGMVAHDRASVQGLALLGSRTDRREAAPGEPVRVTLLWQVVDPGLAAQSGQLTIRLEGQGEEPDVAQSSPLAGAYPPSRWQEGDRLRTEILLRLSAGTTGGSYLWRASLAAGEEEDHTWVVGSLRVAEPERRYIAPPLDVTLNTGLGNVATLLGATLSPPDLVPGGALAISLVWRAEHETETSYRVFLHLLGPNGEVVSQSDGEPAGWTRPTTGWLPGEVIVDERELALPLELPGGDYTLAAGLYEPHDGSRLLLPGGTDAITIARMTHP
jgi:hypothetical protein